MNDVSCLNALRALSDETRLRTVQLLAQQPQSVSEIADKLNVTQYNVSKHLRVLREAGLLECRRAGRMRVYGVPERYLSTVAENERMLDIGCCQFRLASMVEGSSAAVPIAVMAPAPAMVA